MFHLLPFASVSQFLHFPQKPEVDRCERRWNAAGLSADLKSEEAQQPGHYITAF